MPELPEVETLRRELERVLPDKKFKKIEVLNSKTVAPLSAKTFKKKLAGLKIKKVSRRAKMLIFDLTGPWSLVVHLKLTGQLIYAGKNKHPIIGGHPADPQKHTRLVFYLVGGDKLIFNDLRKFGWCRLVDNRALEKLTKRVGMEPLSAGFTTGALTDLLTKFPRRTIKQALLDQTLIAGLGNIYADESCFLAKIRPTRRIKSLTKTNLINLRRSIIKILKHSISKKGTSARNYVRSNGTRGGFVPHLNVYGRASQPCKTCGALIKKIHHAGRGTHFCPQCQK